MYSIFGGVTGEESGEDRLLKKKDYPPDVNEKLERWWEVYCPSSPWSGWKFLFSPTLYEKREKRYANNHIGK